LHKKIGRSLEFTHDAVAEEKNWADPDIAVRAEGSDRAVRVRVPGKVGRWG
jgi:hypothetical protein